MAAPWFIKRSQHVAGPFGAGQLRELALAGKLQSNDLVRKGDQGEFVPVSRVNKLFEPDDKASRPTPPPLANAAAINVAEERSAKHQRRPNSQIARPAVIAGLAAGVLVLLMLCTGMATMLGLLVFAGQGGRISQEEYTSISSAKSAEVHEISWEELKKIDSTQPTTYAPVEDIHDVNFNQGPAGEPVQTYRVRHAEGGTIKASAQFYRDKNTDKLVLHGPFLRYSQDGQKLHEYVMVHGVIKAHSAWTEDGRPRFLEIYQGDENCRKYQFNFRVREQPPVGAFGSSKERQAYVESRGLWALNAMTTYKITHFAADDGSERQRATRDGLFAKMDRRGNLEVKSLFRDGEEIARQLGDGTMLMGSFSSMEPADETMFQQQWARWK